MDDAVAKPPRKGLPFYRLYLLSGTKSPPTDRRGEHLLRLQRAGARTCASLLEMLYVPVGRSGGQDECYLLYENYDEFKAAAEFAPTLDEAPLETASSAVGAEASFRAGVALFLRIMGEGAIVDRGRVDECEHHLAEATQSTQLSPLRRWAAGILAGRLVSEYRYDYVGARSYCRQAERAAEIGSIEQMTSQWWQADVFIQEGKTDDAMAVYRSILAAQEGRGSSQIVRRSRAILEQRHKP